MASDAYHMGFKAARDLKIGELFTGAHGAATSHGFPWSGYDREAFITGYLAGIKERFPNGVLVDAEGKLIEDAA